MIMKLLFCDTEISHRTMERRRSSSMLLAAVFSVLLALEDCVYGSNQAEIERHLELGRDMLARGQLQDALSHYHAAVDSDPNNYLTFFKRATVYLALGKAKFALSDLNRVLELKPDFTAARMQTAHVLLKQGDLDAAEQAYYSVLHVMPGSVEAIESLERIEPLRTNVLAAQAYLDNHHYEDAIMLLTSVIDSIPWDLSLREMRAKARMAIGDTRGAMADIRSVTRLGTDNTEGFLMLARLHYDLGEATESLREIRECLRLDADHKECFAHYKIVKKVAKAIEDMLNAVEAKDYQECITSGNKVLKFEEKNPMIRLTAFENLCRCYRHTHQFTDSISNCNSALGIQRVAHILCDRAESFIESEMYEDAIHDYHDALELDADNHRAREGLDRAKKLQKQSERRDYYKILGVSRQATKKEIVKAYRKAAQQWHPDNFQGDEKKLAEKKFIDIAAAKEVLTDPEKRQKFDHGEDPLDPEQQRQQGFNPFQHFHNSPFQFKFHFN